MNTFGRAIRWAGRNSKRAAVTVVGFLLLIVGVILIPLPGPGWAIVFAGLAVLATEYAWARRTLDASKRRVRRARDSIRRRRS